jgi:hypothetical protein
MRGRETNLHVRNRSNREDTEKWHSNGRKTAVFRPEEFKERNKLVYAVEVSLGAGALDLVFSAVLALSCLTFWSVLSPIVHFGSPLSVFIS